MKKTLNWNVGYTEDPQKTPGKRVSAQVPGAVQLDWAKAEGWDDYRYADNFRDYKWMEDVFWLYSCKLDFPYLLEDQQLYFISKGIDYKFELMINGERIYKQEGMFSPVEINLTDKVKQGDNLEVLIYPVPKREGAVSGTKQEADQSCKPAVSYGWDWHPRLIPLGIWDETYLEIRPSIHIKDMETMYNLNNALNQADITVNLSISRNDKEDLKANWKLLDYNNNLIVEKLVEISSKQSNINYCLENPQLWWPNDQGEPLLYNSIIELIDQNGNIIDKKSQQIGFRKVRLVMNEGTWEGAVDFPVSRSKPPITLEINNRRIFAKGSNWVNPEIFPGLITEQTYENLIELAKEGNMNLLRVWGGGIINKDSFYKLCDRAGILVWQEFPLACNNYQGTPEYLNILDNESKAIIKRLRKFTSVILWCGGNELFNPWSRMTDQSKALRLLNKNCYDLDTETPFIMTSPLMGMGHGNYLFRYRTGEEVFQVMPEAHKTAYTEFGCPGPSSVYILKKIIPEDELFPPLPGTAWESHHAFKAWDQDNNSWLFPELIEFYFGHTETLEQLVERGQLLQSEGYKCIYEEARRQKPYCSMALNWCFNEPWPTAANNSLINYSAEPKPAYFAVKDSCRPVLASARISKFCWEEGEIFNPELWILNDSPNSVPGGIMEVYLEIGDDIIDLLVWDFPELEPNKNLTGPTVKIKLPGKKGATKMKLVLKVVDRPEYKSSYFLKYN